MSDEPEPSGGTNGDGSAEETSDDLDPEEAFMLLGHELRVAVLLALWRAENNRLPFAELRQQVGESDSGKFNYHLKQLVGRFVGKSDDQYRLLYPGHRVVDAIHNGVFHRQTAVSDVDISGTCFDCGGPLRFDYDTVDLARVSCRDCGRTIVEYPYDPGGLTDRAGDDLARAFDRRTRLMWARAYADVCPVCSGRVDARFVEGLPESVPSVRDHPVVAGFDCTQCSFYGNLPVGTALLTHPAVQGFCYENGLDVREARMWDLPFVVDPAAVTVLGRDPWRVAVSVTAGGESRTAVLAGVRDVERFE